MTSTIDAPLAPGVAVAESTEGRILDATVCCIGRWAWPRPRSMTWPARLRAAGRRSTGVFPGGKDAFLQAVAQREVARICRVVVAELESAAGLEVALTGAIAATARHLADHTAWQYLLNHEPETVVGLAGVPSR